MATLSPASSTKKKYVTRACDICKRRKCKCDGLEPCYRCVSLGLECSYNASYSRGSKRKWRDEHDAAHPKPRPPLRPNEDIIEDMEGENEARLSTETEDAGDASTHTFLKRVYIHIQSMGQVLPRSLRRPAEQILEEDSPSSIFFPPNREMAQEYVDCFCEHSNATYRYVPRSQIQNLMDGFYAQDEQVLQNDADVAVLLLVMAVGCVWLASWRNLDLNQQKLKGSRIFKAANKHLKQAASSFPPTISILQGHALECQFYLALNMFNTAWLTVGTAIRLGQMIGFQKAIKRDYDLQEYSRRGVFWSLYMMDRYLSAALGRPMALDDGDITIPYPEAPGSALQMDLGQIEPRLMKGVIAHIRLTQMTSKILKQLYSPIRDQSRDDTVLGIERGIETWLQETASFFHPTDEHENERDGHMAFCDIPWILKRQQRTVRAAFHFTTILLYRGYLLDEFLQRNVPRPQPSSCSPAVERCVKAALRLAEFAAEIDTDTSYNPVYWVTSHFTFCAISILTVYMTLYKDPEQQNVIETVLEKAMRGHRKLDNSKNKQSQQLLEESRSIAQAVQSSPIASSTLTTAQPREVRLSSDQPTDHNQPNCCPNEASNLENEDTLVELYNEASWDSQSFASILHGEGLGVIMNVGFDTSLSPFIGIVPT